MPYQKRSVNRELRPKLNCKSPFESMMERVNLRLNRMMRATFDNLFSVSEQHDITLRQAGYVYAIDKVAKTLNIRGIYA